jgi:uncharacterized protein YodC (DUF2158 family)
MASFKPGDVVKLKSGGPRMTVERTGPDVNVNIQDPVACVWFEGSKDTRDTFPAATLESASAKAGIA